jgi:hypothetical protein
MLQTFGTRDIRVKGESHREADGQVKGGSHREADGRRVMPHGPALAERPSGPPR